MKTSVKFKLHSIRIVVAEKKSNLFILKLKTSVNFILFVKSIINEEIKYENPFIVNTREVQGNMQKMFRLFRLETFLKEN